MPEPFKPELTSSKAFADATASLPEQASPETDNALINKFAGRYLVEHSSNGMLGLVVEMKGDPDEKTAWSVTGALMRQLESKGLDANAGSVHKGFYLKSHDSKAGSMEYQPIGSFESNARDAQGLHAIFNKKPVMEEDLHEAAIEAGYDKRHLINVAIPTNGADPDKMISKIGEVYREILPNRTQPAPAQNSGPAL